MKLRLNWWINDLVLWLYRAGFVIPHIYRYGYQWDSWYSDLFAAQWRAIRWKAAGRW